GWRNERVVDMDSLENGRVILVVNDDPPAHIKKVQEIIKMMERRGMNGGIDGGMVVAGGDEVLGITVTCTVRSGESDEIEELCNGTSVFCVARAAVTVTRVTSLT
nr:protein chromosome transmission fidelity 7-like [Tanacetum cinerariifolium]